MPALPRRRSAQGAQREGGRLGVEEPGRDHRVAQRAVHRGAEAPHDLPVVLDVVADEDDPRRGEEPLQLSPRGLLADAALLGAGEGDVAGLLGLVGEGEADEPRGELVEARPSRSRRRRPRRRCSGRPRRRGPPRPITVSYSPGPRKRGAARAAEAGQGGRLRRVGRHGRLVVALRSPRAGRSRTDRPRSRLSARGSSSPRGGKARWPSPCRGCLRRARRGRRCR